MKIQNAYASAHSNPDGGKVDLGSMIERTQEMREFYYLRMTNTSMLLVTAAALAVSIVALVVSLIRS